MTDLQIGGGAVALLLVLIALRVPIGISLIGVSFGGLYMIIGWRAAFGGIGNAPYLFSASWALSSIPMFLLMGYLAFRCGLTTGLFQAARVWTSRIPGGLAIGAVLGCSGFAAICGSSIACSAAMGRISVPEMTRQGYDASFATGTVAVGGTIGALIPPSIVLILYGVLAEVSITKMFLGGMGVGLLSALVYSVVILIRATIDPKIAPRDTVAFSLRDRIVALKDTWAIMVIALGTFGGLFGGIFTPTEAGAVGAFLVFALALVTGKLSLQNFTAAITETLLTTTTLMLIGIGASLFARLLVVSGVDLAIADVISSLYSNQFTLVLLLMLIYLIIGMFLEPLGAMLLTLPIVLPLVLSEGLSPIWFGVFLAKLLEVGMVTPPVGMNVFVMKSVVGDLLPLGAIFRGVFWFVVADIFLLLLIYWQPQLVMWLPDNYG